MKWQKKGLIFAPDGRLPWAKKYAFPPTPLIIGGGVLRLYVAFCDEKTVGRIGFVDVAADDPGRVLRVSDRPVLDIGRPGDFDENGLLPTCVVPVGDKLFMYYVGYQLGQKVRYFQFEGLAISDDGGQTFRRYGRVPVIDRSDAEPHHRTSAFVMPDGDLFKMWYVAGGDWTAVNGKSLPVYNLRYFESPDGKNWPRAGAVCLDFAGPDEHAFGRPWVLKSAGSYRMFYSIRTKSKGYRLGYAESTDGVRWRRKDEEVGIDVSPTGWDSEMIAYSSVVEHNDRTYLFYNGNNCGETGFGYAVLAEG
jgi:sucrose-6-phosphate hydrolase SacC (GH32 family)